MATPVFSSTYGNLSSGAGGAGIGVSGYLSLASAFVGAVDSYYSTRVAQSAYRIQRQQLAHNYIRGQYDFQQSQLDHKSNLLSFQAGLLEQQQRLTVTQFQLKAAQFAMQERAINFEMAALGDEFQAGMAALNARQAEQDAQGALLAGERQIGSLSMAAGALKSSTKASQAARGVALGVGNSGEEIASMDLMKEIDMMSINVNRTYAANQQRTQATNFLNQESLAQVSAQGNRLSSQFSRDSAAIPGGLADIAGNSAAQTGDYANLANGWAGSVNTNVNTTDVPNWVTLTPNLSATQAGLTSLIGGAAPVAASWYQSRETSKQIAAAVRGLG